MVLMDMGYMQLLYIDWTGGMIIWSGLLDCCMVMCSWRMYNIDVDLFLQGLCSITSCYFVEQVLAAN